MTAILPRLSLTILLLVIAAPALADDNAATLRPEFVDTLTRVDRLVRSGRYDDALVIAKRMQTEAQGDYELLKAHETASLVYVGMHDPDNAAAAAEAAADMPVIPDKEKAEVFTNAARLAMDVQHYDKAAKYGHALQAMNLKDAVSQRLIARALAHEPKP